MGEQTSLFWGDLDLQQKDAVSNAKVFDNVKTIPKDALFRSPTVNCAFHGEKSQRFRRISF